LLGPVAGATLLPLLLEIVPRRGGFEAMMTGTLSFNFSLPTISITSLVRIRHQSVGVPPDDLIAWASFLFELSPSEQHDLAAMAFQ
jgi:hypothetical protein